MELIELIINGKEFLEQSILFQGFRFVIGIILVVLALDIMLLIYILIGKDRYYRGWSLGHGIPDIKNAMTRRWDRVVRMINSEDLQHQKGAIVDASDMVYEILTTIGYEGDNLDEILSNIVSPQLANVDELKNASKIKNLIDADSNYELSNEVALATVRAFGAVLIEQETISEIKI